MRLLLAIVAWAFLGQNHCVLSFEGSQSFRRNPKATRVRPHQQQRYSGRVRASTGPIQLPGNSDSDENVSSSNTNRRRILVASITSALVSLVTPIGPSSVAAALEGGVEGTTSTVEKKPFAPLENLLPAVRVKVSIDAAIRLTNTLVDGGTTTPGADASSTSQSLSQETALAQLENLLRKQPPNYVPSGLPLQGVPSKPADLYLQSYQTLKGDLPFQKALVQSGDVDAWKRLKRREKTLERTNPIRAALNAYTDALSFSGDSYVLRVDAQTKSNMVREDRLPDVKQVITSDMGLRYLYRNQVLTAMDDVQAELDYQLQHKHDTRFEGTELLDLLGLARDAMDRWLSLVPPEDVREAMKVVATEEGYTP